MESFFYLTIKVGTVVWRGGGGRCLDRTRGVEGGKVGGGGGVRETGNDYWWGMVALRAVSLTRALSDDKYLGYQLTADAVVR